MSHTRVKTTYSIESYFGGTEKRNLYCHHNHSCDFQTFHDEDGSITSMAFKDWDKNNLWDAMERLIYPFKDKWGEELKEGVEYYGKAPWEK